MTLCDVIIDDVNLFCDVTFLGSYLLFVPAAYTMRN